MFIRGSLGSIAKTSTTMTQLLAQMTLPFSSIVSVANGSHKVDHIFFMDVNWFKKNWCTKQNSFCDSNSPLFNVYRIPMILSLKQTIPWKRIKWLLKYECSTFFSLSQILMVFQESFNHWLPATRPICVTLTTINRTYTVSFIWNLSSLFPKFLHQSNQPTTKLVSESFHCNNFSKIHLKHRLWYSKKKTGRRLCRHSLQRTQNSHSMTYLCISSDYNWMKVPLSLPDVLDKPGNLIAPHLQKHTIIWLRETFFALYVTFYSNKRNKYKMYQCFFQETYTMRPIAEMI